MTAKPKIVVLDDDPTGSQTVHSCLLLTKWDVDTLRFGLRDSAPIMFVLTNTRAIEPEAADRVTREVCHNLKQAIAAENIAEYMVVSRSDSTLRGHYPIETDAIAAETGPFDAHFLVPAFFEGGRVTIDSTHYLIIDGKPVPTHDTEFAKDSVFGYSTSYLPDYVAEKTKGKIAAEQVERFLLADIRAGSLDRLLALSNNQCGVVDAETQADLDKFAADVLAAAAQGKKFLFRSAASILTALAQLPPQPVAPEQMSTYVRTDQPGAVIVGSHVKKTTAQLAQLLKQPGVAAIEIEVKQLLTPFNRDLLLQQALEQVRSAHGAGKTPVVYTSREELQFEDVQTRLKFGEEVSDLLMQIVKGLPAETSFLISKGGITSNDVLSKGLELTTARLLGQIIAGCSVVRTPAEREHLPNLPVVLFPGNVGDDDALATVYQRLTTRKPTN
ncbi:type III effector Hrp-dependent outer [Thalassoporum mexicanum PCC 7367]|uniref:four-carbon acid sugar kinase family protein n=1 Tax=Thalassoporum mexicanum TaxID=3457544 RepID=UPI00029F882B|nr:four-carbon acid sugar kinase family protein [Pseudanabaena sp. PCC 7367]AFY68346.1 type III effector Hrp-dependent outer [Pseudanabaena sp. PCC 7367]